MPTAFALVHVHGTFAGNALQAVEALLERRIPGAPIGFTGQDDRRAASFPSRFPELVPWIDGPCITILRDSLPPADSPITPEIARQLARFPDFELTTYIEGPEEPAARGFETKGHGRRPPFAAWPVCTIGKSYGPRPSIRVSVPVPIAPGRDPQKAKSPVATELVRAFGASPRTFNRDLIVPEGTEAIWGRHADVLVPASPWEPGAEVGSAPASPTEPVPDALDALRSGDTAGAIRHLLALWQSTPHGQIAEALDTVSRLHLWHAGAPSETGRALEARLDQLADTGDPADQPAFAAGLLEVSSAVALRLLGRWPGPDPRWTAELVWWLRGGRHDGAPVARGIRDRWADLPDHRLAAVVDGLDPSRSFGSTQWDVLYTMQQDFPRPGPDAPLPSDTSTWLDAVASHAGAALQARLEIRDRALTLAAAQDLASLAVLADALIEEGDPYGRFLQLQVEWEQRGRLSGPLKNEMLALLRSHQAAWLHPLPYLVSKIRTRLGRPESAHLASTPPQELFAGLEPTVLDGLQTLTCTIVPRGQPPGGPWRVVPKGSGATLERSS
ncbi:MAG: hypothetical protein R3F61_08895 [Myxococcota bacterium]